MHTNKLIKMSLNWLLVIAFVVGLMVPLANAKPINAAASTNFTLQGYNIPTTGQFSPGWTGGNLGKSYDEGEWVPYQFTITNVQANYPNLNNFTDIKISYDFTSANDRFGDLVRDIQVGTTILSDSQAFPNASGSAYSITSLADVNLPQNDPAQRAWSGFQLLNLPNSQVNIPLSGSPTVTDDRHMFVIHPSDLTNHGIAPTANTIVVYFQIHEARTFVWNNSLQSGYAVPPTDAWGGYLYGSAPFSADKRLGSGFVPGSSGHVHNEGIGGSQDVPLPIPPEPAGAISGMKWQDSNSNGIKDTGETPLANWGIHITAILEGGLVFTNEIYTDANGNYNFPNLVAGVWTVSEHLWQGSQPQGSNPTWVETYPSAANPGGTVGAGVAGPVATPDPSENYGAYGWVVTLTSTNITQSGLNFGNVLNGSLVITKSVVLGSVVNQGGITQDFIINVTGPAPSTAIVGSNTFHLVNGVLQAPTSFSLNNLAPGTYTASEIDPGANWSVSGTGNISVVGGQTASATVTNTFVPSSLQITKMVDFGGANSTLFNQTFTATVTGPSFPSGTSHDFVITNGVLSGSPWLLTNLIPGNYSIAEGAVSGWTEVVNSSSTTVVVGQQATATITNTFVPGALTVTKLVDLDSVPNSSSITDDFTIQVTGISGTFSQVFHLANGLVTPSSWTIPNLIPGSYTITETIKGVNYSWTVTGEGNVTVNSNATATANVTNTFVPGELDVTKVVTISGDVMGANTINDTFTVKVTGPSYPSGITQDFTYNGTSVSPNPWKINNLIPGNYTVEETVMGNTYTWNAVVTGSGAVTAGGIANATVTNTFVPGSLSINKVLVDTGYLFPNNITEDFTVTVTGPSYPSGTNVVFQVVNGVLNNSPQTLSNLIPGTYTVSEVTPADGMWMVTGGGNVTVIAGQTASSTITNTIKLPHTSMTLAAPSAFVTEAGQTITLTVSDLNDGAVPLSQAHVHLTANGVEYSFSPMFGSSTADYSFSGDTNGNGLFDPSETWTWQVQVTVNASTTFVTWGHGTDPLGNPVDYNMENPNDPTSVSSEHMEFEVKVTNTTVDISSQTNQIETGTATYLTVSEDNTGDVALTTPHVVILKNGAAFMDLTAAPTSGDMNNDGILDPGETWIWSGINTGTLTADTTFQSTGHGWTPGDSSFDVTYPAFPTERDSVSIDVIHPNTSVTITPNVFETAPGENVLLTITEQNTGDVDLSNAYVVLNPGTITLNNTSAGFSSSGNNDSTLAVGEKWIWTDVPIMINVTTQFVVTGHGTDPLNLDITYPVFANEQASVTVQVTGATRTQGFWATHLDFTTYIFNNYAGNDINLKYPVKTGPADVNSMDKLMGIFWANNAKNSDGSKRSAIGQARETTANQALAAVLNSVMPGGKKLPMFNGTQLTIDIIGNILNSNNINDIKALGSTLDAFNNSGDTVALDSNLPATGKADPQGAKTTANIKWADTP